MGTDIDMLVKGMNKASNLEINIEFIMEMIEENNKLLNQLESFIIEKLEIKEYCEEEVRIKLDLTELRNDILASKFEQTKDITYNKIIELRKLNNKKKSIENILKNATMVVSLDGKTCKTLVYSSEIRLKDVGSAYIKPIYTKNKKDMISVAKPSLNCLSIETIKEITEFSSSRTFESIGKLISFLKKFNIVIRRSNGESSYLIKGLTLYFNVQKTIPVYVVEEFQKTYENLFSYEFEGFQFLERKRKIYSLTESINEKNYECFKEVWEKCRCKLILTIELIKEGFCDFSDFNRYYDKDKRDVAIRKDFSERRNYEEKLIKLINELKKFDINAEKYKVELTNIIKGFRESELTIDQEINKNDKLCEEKNVKAIVKEVKTKVEEKKYIEYYDTEKAREHLVKRGASKEHIDEQIKNMKSWSDGINDHINDNELKLISVQHVGASFENFLFAGKGQRIAIRLVGYKNEVGSIVYHVCVQKSKVGKDTTITAEKGSLHKTLIIEYEDGTTVTIIGRNKEDSIGRAMTTVINRLY